MKTDGRTKYTKMVIKQAFFSLMKDLPVEKVTVAQICRLAEINRATFYRYYDSQYDLLSCLENEMLEEIKEVTYQCGDDVDKLTEVILCKFYEQKQMWNLLLSDHADMRFQGKIYDFFAEHFAKIGCLKEGEIKYHFMLYGYSGLIDDWAKNGMKISPKDFAKQLNFLRHKII